MGDFTLELRSKMYVYDITGDLFFQHEGRLVQGARYYIERNDHEAEVYAMMVVTTDGEEILFEGLKHGNWSMPIQRLFEQHMHATGQWGTGYA